MKEKLLQLFWEDSAIRIPVILGMIMLIGVILGVIYFYPN